MSQRVEVWQHALCHCDAGDDSVLCFGWATWKYFISKNKKKYRAFIKREMFA